MNYGYIWNDKTGDAPILQRVSKGRFFVIYKKILIKECRKRKDRSPPDQKKRAGDAVDF